MKIGVIGYGKRAGHIMAALQQMEPQCDVTAITDTSPDIINESLGEKSNNIHFYEVPEHMLEKEKLDGIIIGTRCSLHTKMALKVFPYNLPLFLEKPVAINETDLLKLKKGHEEFPSPVMVSFPLRATPIIEQVKKIIDSGLVGTIEHVQAVNNVPYGGNYYQGWYRDEEETGGLFLQKATHDFDYINYLVGSTPVQISAMQSKQIYKGQKPAGLMCVNCEEKYTCRESAVMKRLNEEQVFGEYCCFANDTGNHDSASVLIRYDTGMHAVYSQNFFVRKEAKARGARLMGYKGTVEFDFYTDTIKVFMHHNNRVETHVINEKDRAHFGGDRNLARNFIAMMRGNALSISTLEDGILSALMCIKARESAMGERFEEITFKRI
ncbi:Gfo/Idh/MocA family protein [Sutcliffiella sp. NPDC057660]|uniref:Gfo/Idh/MocA family protein n=1 Tax=Sutcliffiella sp. NPDC057660 TaxID=3346199 RepID=UPI003693F686